MSWQSSSQVRHGPGPHGLAAAAHLPLLPARILLVPAAAGAAPAAAAPGQRRRPERSRPSWSGLAATDAPFGACVARRQLCAMLAPSWTSFASSVACEGGFGVIRSAIVSSLAVGHALVITACALRPLLCRLASAAPQGCGRGHRGGVPGVSLHGHWKVRAPSGAFLWQCSLQVLRSLDCLGSLLPKLASTFRERKLCCMHAPARARSRPDTCLPQSATSQPGPGEGQGGMRGLSFTVVPPHWCVQECRFHLNR